MDSINRRISQIRLALKIRLEIDRFAIDTPEYEINSRCGRIERLYFKRLAIQLSMFNANSLVQRTFRYRWQNFSRNGFWQLTAASSFSIEFLKPVLVATDHPSHIQHHPLRFTDARGRLRSR